MVNTEEKYQKRRLRSSYITSVISITLVLFLLGILGIILINAKNLSDYVRENIGLTIVLKENSKEADILQMQKMLESFPYVKSTEYVTKEQAAKALTEDLGENFVDFIGYNPLLPSIEVKLYADYANNENMGRIERQWLKMTNVKEVYYQKNLVQQINDNVSKITVVLLAFSFLILLVAVTLINNTIRLSVYARRLLIRSMQLVGATSSFIRKPFVIIGVVQGLIASVLANVMLILLIVYIQGKVPELVSLKEIDMILLLCLFIIILGVVFAWISSVFAVRRFLKMDSNKINF